MKPGAQYALLWGHVFEAPTDGNWVLLIGGPEDGHVVAYW